MTRAALCLLAALASSTGSTALAADIHVMSGGAPKEVLTELVPEFEKATGHKVRITYIVISAMQQKLAAGEKPDMVLMPAPVLEAQVKAGVMRDAPRPNLGVVRIGLVVREGAAKPDISTLDKFKAALLDAKSVVHSNPAATPSGGHLAKVWERLGIADAMKPKLTFSNALDGGVAALAKGEAEIGLYPLSEIIHEKGVTVVGLIPQEIQLNTVYATGVLAANAAPEPAVAFVKFLADPAHAKHWKDAGFEPATK
ncbi:MAG: molybdate transport system substrate-binding protein [Hyphomicrobiales bacterium]|jgi:molybdate transport system substrate-binding protein|nr:molybdate transport system substrate-binding protein [Hyphomicrobiales bacterium]